MDGKAVGKFAPEAQSHARRQVDSHRGGPFESALPPAGRPPHGRLQPPQGLRGDTAKAETAWLAALRAVGIEPQDVVQILVTHFHPDHFGAAGWLRQLSGAAVLMHETEAETARRVRTDAFTAEMAAFGNTACPKAPRHP